MKEYNAVVAGCGAQVDDFGQQNNCVAEANESDDSSESKKLSKKSEAGHDFCKDESLTFFCNHLYRSLQHEIAIIFYKLENNQKLTQDEISSYASCLLRSEKDRINMVLFYLLKYVCYIFKRHQDNISKLIHSLENETDPPPNVPEGTEHYYDLLNGYLLLSDAVYIRVQGNYFPGFNRCQEDQLYDNIAFAINALHLSGKLPSSGNYATIGFGEPLYPIGMRQNSKITPLTRGIKPSSNYFPIKRVKKIAKGETGDVVLLLDHLVFLSFLS